MLLYWARRQPDDKGQLMQKLTLPLAAAALLISIVALVRPFSQKSASPEKDSWKSERHFPPLVFTGQASLDCSISSTANGRQVMTTMSGQGFTFDTTMLPIKDGRVKLKDPGMLYKFTAFPSSPVPARFSGLGEGTITQMQAEVEVDVKHFSQPAGPGTTITFKAEDINADAAYVEFTGLFVRQRDQKRFPFRVIFGSVVEGRGTVTPEDAGRDTRLVSKSVMLGSPQHGATVTTALYEAEDEVRDLTRDINRPVEGP